MPGYRDLKVWQAAMRNADEIGKMLKGLQKSLNTN